MIPEFSSLPCSTRPQRFEFGVCSLEILVPTDPEEMLNEAVEHEDSDERTTDPYWGLLWDAAPRTATFLCRSPLTASHSVRGLTALELGCGIGLAGVAALHCGMQVTFSDLVPAAVALALENARRNGFRNASGL
ncbi:MAG: hypothetical protein KDA96_25500, partial [Planctomycetaceae bacterium]|nr:hypothetical protein [Planctomycetaceae bacterium]